MYKQIPIYTQTLMNVLPISPWPRVTVHKGIYIYIYNKRILEENVVKLFVSTLFYLHVALKTGMLETTISNVNKWVYIMYVYLALINIMLYFHDFKLWQETPTSKLDGICQTNNQLETQQHEFGFVLSNQPRPNMAPCQPIQVQRLADA